MEFKRQFPLPLKQFNVRVRSLGCTQHLLSNHWGSDPLNTSATCLSTQGSYYNKYQACSSSRTFWFPDGAKLLPQDASKKGTGNDVRNTWFVADYQTFWTLTSNCLSGSRNWRSNSIFQLSVSVGVNLRFRSTITAWLISPHMSVWLLWWPSSNRLYSSYQKDCKLVHSDPTVNNTMFCSIVLNCVTSFACENHEVKRAKPIRVCKVTCNQSIIFLNSS